MKPPRPPQRTSSTVARVYRCLAAVIFLCSGTLAAGCSRLTPPKNSESRQDCELNSSYQEHIDYVHAHVLKVVQAHYTTAVSDKPGHIQTDYEPLQQQPTGDDPRRVARVIVSLALRPNPHRHGPEHDIDDSNNNLGYEVQIEARAQLENRTSNGRIQRMVPAHTPWLRTHVRKLRQQIHQRMSNIASDCQGRYKGADFSDFCDGPKGTPADMRMPVPLPEGVSVSLPEFCEGPSPEAYIRVQRQRPTSQTSMTRRPDSSVKEGEFSPRGCFLLPKDPRKIDEYPAFAKLHALLPVARERARAAGIRVSDNAACIPRSDDYDCWYPFVGIRDWRDAGRTTQILAEVLEEGDLDGYAGVSVHGDECSEMY